jgi:FtsZ-binding cell division protein ZapB
MKKLHYIIIPLAFSLFIGAQEIVDETLNSQVDANIPGIVAQKEIDNLDEQAKKLYYEFKDTVSEYEGLRRYDDQLEKIVFSQEEEINSILKQIDSLDNVNKEILPFLKETIDSLRKFVNLDIPFLKESRLARLDNLDSIILKSNVTTAEKFRKVFEAYQVETAFGNTIETYPGFIELEGQTITVDYFRMGRLGWYYRSANGKESGYWNKFEDSWVHTNGKLNDEIKLALDIANRQTPPNFITLPVQPVEK